MAFINKRIEDLINFRIVEEEKSSRLYLAMSKWLKYQGYEGAAALWQKYSDEELAHSKKAYTYLEELDILPTVPTIPQPQLTFTSLPEICKLSLDHELLITEQCNTLAKKAFEEKDFMTTQLAQWYLTEQTEEIGKVTYWLNRIDVLGGENINSNGLFLLDQEMAKHAG